MTLRLIFFIAAALALASSCAKPRTAKSIPAAPQLAPRKVRLGEVERGVASWYGEPYHGRRAANGEVFDMGALTAAHRTMPFGTWLRVDNETNRKSVNVRVIDRGPFVQGRVIDLSRRAAEEISMIGPGLAPVKLTVISPPPGQVREEYGVQLAAWADRERSEALRRQLLKHADPVRVLPDNGAPRLYRVVAGAGNKDDAKLLLARLQRAGYRGFVLRLDTLDIDTAPEQGPNKGRPQNH